MTENNQEKDMSRVIAEIAAERKRQIETEGWTAEHDDQHYGGSLALAAGSYAIHAGGMTTMGSDEDGPWSVPQNWPWDVQWWKPSTPRRDLIKAAALIVAEIERLDRLSPAVDPDKS